MDIIDNEDLHIDNIAGKIQMIKALLETLKKEQKASQRVLRIRCDFEDFTN